MFMSSVMRAVFAAAMAREVIAAVAPDNESHGHS